MPTPFHRNVFIGLDMSLSSTGFCAVNLPAKAGSHRLHNHSILNMGTIDPGNLSGPARLEHIFNRLAPLLEELKPVLVAIEGYAHGASFQAHALGEVGGMARLLLWKLGVPYVEVQPTTLKMWLTGKGKATKPQIRKAILAKWGRDIKDNNQGDAFGLSCVAGLASAPDCDDPTMNAAEYSLVSGLRLCSPPICPPFPLLSRKI